MIIFVRGLILGLYSSILCCSTIGMIYVLYNSLIDIHMIFLYTCIFAIILSLIMSYPFFKLCEYLTQLNIFQPKDDTYGVFNGKFK